MALGLLVSASPPPHWVEPSPDDADAVLLPVLLELVAPQPATASTPTTPSATMRHRGLLIALMCCVPFVETAGLSRAGGGGRLAGGERTISGRRLRGVALPAVGWGAFDADQPSKQLLEGIRHPVGEQEGEQEQAH